MQATRDAIIAMTDPAAPDWIAQRIYILIADYFVSEIPQQVAEHQARVWVDQLAGYPQWAIESACVWWGSRNNKKRRQKPVHGDIAERCEIEMGAIRMAQVRVRQYTQYGDNPPDFLK